MMTSSIKELSGAVSKKDHKDPQHGQYGALFEENSKHNWNLKFSALSINWGEIEKKIVNFS